MAPRFCKCSMSVSTSLSRKEVNVDQLCAEYLMAVEYVTAAVDRLLDALLPAIRHKLFITEENDMGKALIVIGVLVLIALIAFGQYVGVAQHAGRQE